MAKRTAQSESCRLYRSQNSELRSFREQGAEVSRVTTLERPDLLILLGLAVVTFGIYAQVMGHRFITLDPTYIQTIQM
jgi:hypothetical protein